MKLFKTMFVFLMAAVFALSAGAAMAEDQITMTGSTTVLPFAQATAEAYMKKNPDVNISVAGTGSGDGIKAIIDNTTDIGNASRDMKDKEVKLAEKKGATPVKHVIALDAIVPIVHPSNPVEGLTKDQLKAIYTGGVKKWEEIGGPKKGIAVISRDSSSGTFGEWARMVLDGEKVRPDAQLQASNGAVQQAVAGNKYAIGYVGLAYIDDSVKPLTVNGVSHEESAYPVARELYMFTNGEPKGKVKDYIDFVLGPEGQEIVKKHGGIPVN
jgi:phosphate transport system substrate-binding protein